MDSFRSSIAVEYLKFMSLNYYLPWRLEVTATQTKPTWVEDIDFVLVRAGGREFV